MVNPTGREHTRALAQRLLSDAERELTIVGEDGEQVEIILFQPENLDAEQVGYAFSPDGESFVGGPGEWQAGWLVIGYDANLGDPYFVDLGQDQCPVLTAMHGSGTWVPELVATSLKGFLASESGRKAERLQLVRRAWSPWKRRRS